MKIIADLAKCVGAGQCIANAPGLFKQDEATGLVVVLKPSPSQAERGDALVAVDTCPSRALRIED